MATSLSQKRYWIATAFVAVLFLLVIYQLLQLTVFHRPALLNLANKQHLLKVDDPPFRGEILDRKGREFATNLRVPSVYAVPKLIDKEELPQLIKKVSKILKLDKDYVSERLNRNKSFVWLKRRVPFEEAEEIQKLKSIGLGILDEPKRFYPQSDLLAQVLGFTDVDNAGLEGIELALNRELQGRGGYRYTKRDAMGREIKAFETSSMPAIDGNKIHLTIDQYVQYLAERALERAYTQWHAKGAWVVVMNPKSGEILAIANRPTYDPNDYQSSNVENKRNRVITDMYEPGSVFKIVATSGALNENKITPDTEVYCENGLWHYGAKTLHDVHSYGKLTFTQVLVKSSNIGSVKIGLMLGPELLYKYVKDYGFGEKTGVDLVGEAGGFIRKPDAWSKTSPYNIPIGHEVMVTALQMATAYSVIANGGELVQPYIISKIEDQAGVTLKENKPHVKRRVIRPEVAKTMREILGKVVTEGTGTKAKIDGIPVGGKTGTAQKVLSGGRGYSHDAFMSSFIGFAPVDDPQLVIAVVLDTPKPSYYGGTVAAPVLKEIMEAALLYMHYVPTNAETLGGGKKSAPQATTEADAAE